MDLSKLASVFVDQAAQNQGNITINEASFTAGGVTVPAGIDDLLQKGFALASGVNLLINASEIPVKKNNDPPDNSLVIKGKLSVLGVELDNTGVTFTITGTGTGQDVSFTILVSLSNWKFETSWPHMTGGVYSSLPYANPAFIFSSSAVDSYSWQQNNISLVAGQNFACTITLTGILQQVTFFLTSWNGNTNLALAGMLDPSKVDNDTVLYPDLDLKVSFDASVNPLGFLNISSPAIGFKITSEDDSDGSTSADSTAVATTGSADSSTSEPTDNSILQLVSLYFELQLALAPDSATPLSFDFTTSITPSSGSFYLAVTPTSDNVTPANLFTLMAGNNWYQVLPPTLLQFLNVITFKGFAASIDYNTESSSFTINNVTTNIGSNGKWELFSNFVVNNFDVQWVVLNPGSGGTNKQNIYLTADVDFFPNLFQGGFHVEITSDLNLSANFSGSVSFNQLVSDITGGFIQIPTGIAAIEFTGFGIVMDIKNKFYSFYADVNIGVSIPYITNISLTNGKVELTSSTSSANSGKSVYTAEVSGLFAIGSLQLNTDVKYNSSTDEGGWDMNISMPADSTLNLGELIDSLFKTITSASLPSGFLPSSLLITEFSLVANIPNQATSASKYTVKTALDWNFTFPIINEPIEVKAKLLLEYQSGTNGGNATYNGGVLATILLKAFNAEIDIAYDFSNNDQKLKIIWEGFQAEYDIAAQSKTITFSIVNWSVGSLLTSFMKMLGDPNFEIDSPWDFLNDISLDGLVVTYNLDNSDITVNYPLPKTLDLVFIKIDSINLTKNSKGTFISFGGSSPIEAISQSSLFNPGPDGGNDVKDMPAVPGQGSEYFELRLLAMGQHIELANASQFTSIKDVVEQMEKAFDEPDPNNPALPVGPDANNQLINFNENSNWLIATDFGILNVGTKEKPVWTVDMQIVFNDPALYGLRIALSGAKAKIFAGLEFDIMYKKISDSIGVYQIDLTLPDALRNLQFGAVNITLPAISLEIYTNGDFLIDVGFPHNMDFSRSFTLQAIVPPGIPAMGSGGFYFGKLSSATTNKVPATQYGNFNPVIVFGIGLQVGVGYSVNYGVLSAGFSLTLFGIIEGLIATYHPYVKPSTDLEQNPQSVETSYYYYLQGTIGIIGKLYGSIDFGIISASVNITIQIYAQATFEAYNKIPLSIVASVDVKVSASLNLGLFSITIHFSFTANIRQDLTIGTDNRKNAPWNINNSSSRSMMAMSFAQFKQLALILPPLSFNVGITANPSTTSPSLNIYFVPHLTISGPEIGSLGQQQAQYVAMLFIDAPNPSGSAGPTSSFENLCTDLFRWLIVNAFSPTATNFTRAEADAQGISKDQLTSLVEYLSDKTNPFPIPTDKILGFLQNTFSAVNISAMENSISSGAIFPMFYDLLLNVPQLSISIDFSQYNMATTEYLQAVKEYFAELAVSMQKQPDSIAAAKLVNASQDYSLATFVFEDYFVLLSKQLAGYASDAMDNYTYPLIDNPNGNSLNAIVTWANGINAGGSSNLVSVQDIATANQDHPLAPGIALNITGLMHFVKPGTTTPDSFTSIAKQYAITPVMVVLQNSSIPNILAEQSITFNGASYNVALGDTIDVVASKLNATTAQLAADNKFQTTAILGTGMYLAIAATVYSANTDDTFASIISSYNGVTASAVLMQNQATPGLFITGKSFNYDANTKYTIVPGDTVSSIATALSAQTKTQITAQNVADCVNVQSLNIQPNGQVLIPSFNYTTATFTKVSDADTLNKIASKYNVTAAEIALNYAIQQISNLLYTDNGYANANVPGLSCLNVGAILQYLSTNNSYSHLSGMVSNYQLHGMRLPVSNQPGLTLATGSPCINQETCALYAMTGQEFALPASIPANLQIELVNNSSALSWLKFKGPNAQTLQIQLQDTDYKQISTVLSYAQTTGLQPKDVQLNAMAPFNLLPVHYTFQSVTKWQTSGSLALPYGNLNNQSAPSPLIWAFPSGMLKQLALHKVAGSKFNVQIGKLDAATGVMNYTPSANYGFNTMVEIEIKKLAADTTSVTNGYTYELLGAKEAGALLLQELLTSLDPHSPTNNANIVTDIQWLYDGSDGVLSVGMANMKSFIVQANQSTETNPSNPPMMMAMMMSLEETEEPKGILNSTYDFIRLLWECSITRSGGYYLLYNETEADKGFPDSIFAKGDTATVRIMIGYNAAFNSIPTNYMNCAVTADKIDLSSCVVYAESAVQTGLIANVEDATDTLASITSKYNILISELATLNSNIVLNTTIVPLPVIQLNGLVHEVGRGNIQPNIGSIATYYNVSQSDIQTANPTITNWNNLQLWQLVSIPTVNYTVSTTQGGPGNTLAQIAAYYFIDMSTLAWAAKDVNNLFTVSSQLNVNDQILHKVSNVQQGTAGFELQRASANQSAQNQLTPSDNGYAENYLNNLFNLLSYNVVGNAAFNASKVGLPVGPATQQSQDDMLGKTTNNGSDIWNYTQIVPVAKFAVDNTFMQYPVGFPQKDGNPYRGIGHFAQVHFDWVDYYGNNTVTPFSNPTAFQNSPLNNPPIAIGYTDELIGIAKWPSIETSYYFDIDSETTKPALILGVTFSNKRYVPIPNVDASQQQNWRENAQNDLALYTAIYYQLSQLNPFNGNNTVSISLTNSLTPGVATSINPTGDLFALVKGIYTYLTQIISSTDEASVPSIPSPVMPPITTDVNIADIDVSSILQLNVALAFSRDIAFVHPDFKDSTAVTQSISSIKPQTSFTNTKVVNNAQQPTGNSVDAAQASLKEFANRFEAAFYNVGNYLLKVAIGTNSSLAGSNNNSNQAVYIVRMGMVPKQGIYWNIVDAGSFEITQHTIDGLTTANVPTEVITKLNSITGTVFNNKSSFDIQLLTTLGQSDFATYATTIYSYSLLNPIFYAPRPLATSLISKSNIPISVYTTANGLSNNPELKNFTGIDLDNWGAQALNAIDVFLSSDYSVPAFIVDQLKSNDEETWLSNQGITADSFMEAITDAKKTLADAISGELEPILSAPAIPIDSLSLPNAKEKFRQQLLNQLSNAYTLNALVQFKTTATSDFKPSGNNFTPPRLYGVPVIVSNIPGIADVTPTTASKEYSISTAKIQLNEAAATDDDSFLTFGFTTKNPDKAASIQLDMSYVVTHVEFEITNVSNIEGYQGSNWLTFIVPADVTTLNQTGASPTNQVLTQQLGTVDIPIVLRNYPTAPALTTQVCNPVQANNNITSEVLEKASEWDYVYSFSRNSAAQDTIFSEVEFFIPASSSASLLKASGRDLFTDLAQFVAVWPAILQDFNNHLTKITINTAANDTTDLPIAYQALQAFVTITTNLSLAWKQYQFNYGTNGNGGSAGNGNRNLSYFSIKQEAESTSDNRLLLSVNTSLSQTDLDYFGVQPSELVTLENSPYVTINTYNTVPALDANNKTIPNSYWFEVPDSNPVKYLTLDEALSIPDRSINLDSLNVLEFQYAWGGVAVIRNEGLIDWNPTSKKFIYRTPLVRFTNKLIPLLSNEDLIDIAKIKNESGQTLPLAQQLSNFFQTFLTLSNLQSGTVEMKLTATWNYPLVPGGTLINLSAIQLPILLAPPFQFQIPFDYVIPQAGCSTNYTESDPLVCRLSNAIKMWYQQYKPVSNGAWIQFDLSAFSSLTENKLPLIDLQNIVLHCSNINDLTQ